jgi:hypothetical protein
VASPEDNVEIERAMKAILNKLTVERFEALYQQLVGCGISNATHVEALIRELFEKATTQHHFIGMYAELCVRLNSWFVDTQIFEDEGRSFKRLLLSRCQRCFEDIFRPFEIPEMPKHCVNSEQEEEEATHLRKTQMLGNLKFIGALLERGMLASRILISVVEELQAMGTSAALECLAVFLTAVGPSFDRPAWTHHTKLVAAFRKVQGLAGDRQVPSRCRFLLQDLLDLRASNWQNKKKAVRTEDGPTTIEAVHRQAAEEEFAAKPHERTPMRPTTSRQVASGFGQGNWVPVGATAPAPPPCSDSGKSSSRRATSTFDKKAFVAERVGILRRLRRSCEPSEAYIAFKEWSVPLEFQASELVEILPQISAWGSEVERCAGFELLARLFITGTWRSAALGKGLSEFFGNFAELKLDVPALPRIVREELAPSLNKLIKAGLLEEERGKRFLAMAA